MPSSCLALKGSARLVSCLPFVENKAHMHMLCVYGLKCWRRFPAALSLVRIHIHIYHDGEFCPGSRLGRQPTPHFKPLPIMCWDHRSCHHQHSWRAPGRRTATPYSLDINLITTRLSIAANRRVVNRFHTRLSDSAQRTSSCAAPCRARDPSFFFWCYAATQLALQLQQECTQVVCSNREAQKRPAWGHSRNGPWTWVLWFVMPPHS